VLVIGLFGPTASGKSDVAAAVTELIPAEVVSADAMQLYDGLPILTNRSPHPERLVGIWPLSHVASVGQYAPLAHRTVDEILATGRTPLVVGGTGLYFRAALAELELPPAPAPGARERWERFYDEDGAAAAHARLAELDPAAAERVHPNDRRRVVRALELHAAGSSLAPEHDRLWGDDARHPTTVIGLAVPAAAVAERIDRRTRAMFDAGVVAEVRAARGAGRFSATAERIHGLQDVTDLLEGRIDRVEAERRLALRTRRYAKRQRTWMRRLPGLRLLDADRDAAAVAAEIEAGL
jgi:tRNA dimethylallyltransferase